MKIKTSELQSAALDWAVAKCEGQTVIVANQQTDCLIAESCVVAYDIDGFEYDYLPSVNWSVGGSIIDRIDGFQLKDWLESKPESKWEAHIHNYDGDWIAFGPTLLIAAMRCYVVSKLGDEIEIPNELAK